MMVRALTLVFLLPWLGEAAQQYYGTQAVALALEGTPSQDDLQLLAIRSGDLITVENVRASIQALHDSGKYAYVEVDATPAGSGTQLTFRVRPHFFFSTIRLEPDDLLERPISSYTRLPVGDKFSRSVVQRLVEETVDLLKAQGYFEATVQPEFVFDDATRLAFVTLKAEPGPRARLAAIQVQGGEETFSHEEVLDFFDAEQGDEFLQAEIDRGVAEIRNEFLTLGFLNTRISLEQNYDPATTSVALKLSIEPGQFTLVESRGYDLSQSRLRELIPIYEEGTVDADLVEEGRVQVQEHLNRQGYFEASVSSEIIEAPLNDAIQINYLIEPGERHRVSSVEINGNRHFDTDEIRRRMQIRSAGLFDKGLFSPAILEEDTRTIQAMYRNAGFLNTVVRGSFEEREHAVDVIIQIEEGEQLPIEYIAFIGNFAVPEQELREAIELKVGDTYAPEEMNDARSTLMGLYYSRGYADVRVEADAERVQSNHGMRVRFGITEGESYQIGKIVVAGNKRTQEKIIHRYSNLFPNTPYNPEAILEGQQRLYATGLFTRVEIVSLREGLQTTRNLLIQVEDASPILLTYGLGVQEFEGPRATVEISHNNLFGLDRAISLRVRGSRREQRFQATYREPRLFNRNIDGFASLFAERAERPDFDADRFDLSFQTVKRFSPQQNLLLSTSYQTVNLRDIRVNPRAEDLPEERGIIQIARIGASFIQDRRDDAIEPTEGTFNTTTFQVASESLGSEVNFTSIFNQSNHYSRLGPGVLANSVRLGWNHPFGGTTRLPPTERYFAGGSTTLRAYDIDEVLRGGGNVMTIANIEYRVALPRLPINGIGGALFYDTGNVFPRIADVKLKDFTHTAGFGLRYNTPLGPVRLDFGFNLKPRRRPDGSREELVQVFFTLGHPF